MDVTPFWQPFQNVMAMQRATADRRVDLAQNNAVMDMKRQEFEMQRRQNALSAAKQQAELDQAMREQQMREELASMFTPQQTGGPLMDNGGSYQPLSQTSGQPTQAQLLPLLARMGKTTEVFNALAPREMAIVDGNYVDKYGGGARQIEGFTPTSKYSPEYQAFLDANFDGKNSAEASAAFEQREIARRSAGAARTSIVNNNNMKRENEALGQAFGEFKDAFPQARTSRQAVLRIDRALDILDKHGNKVTGLSGATRRALAPFATAAGIKIGGMNEAQILQSLLQEGAGSLRMAVIGSGPVSNYEQGILQAVSGGGMSAAEGVRRILGYHRESHVNNIEMYNNRVRVLSQQPGYGLTDQLYPAIDMPKPRAGARNQGGNAGGIRILRVRDK